MDSIYGQTLESLESHLKALGQPAYRAKQVLDWLYHKRVQSIDDMTNLPKALRAALVEQFSLETTSLATVQKSSDVTEKLLLKLSDGAFIETVIIRSPQRGVGRKESRKTVCISTQVGCAYGCRFCASGLAGWKRNLSPGEIVSQLMQVCWREDAVTERADDAIASFDNIVVMGMGEPLANYDNLLQALRILNAPWGLGFGARRITVSTSGLVPQIYKLAEELMSFRLAISLHGSNDEVRNQIMPVNRRYPLKDLLPAAKAFAQKHGRMLTLEYILIQDINDALEQARELVDIAKDLHAHVNLIPYNTVEGLEWVRPELPQLEAFYNVLKNAGVSATLRREKGHSIDAACGQLRLKEMKKAF